MHRIIRVCSPDGQCVASACGNYVALWEGSDRDPVRVLEGSTSAAITAIAWTPDGQRVLAGTCDGTVLAWEARSGERLLCWHAADPVASVNGIACSHQHLVAILAGSNHIRVLDMATGRTISQFRSALKTTQLTWTPDGQVLYSHTVPLWSPSDVRVRSMIAQMASA